MCTIFPHSTGAVEGLLMFFLHFAIGVSEYSFASCVKLGLLRASEALVQHHLVVLNEVHFAFILLTEVILTLTVLVSLLCHRCCVTHVSLSKAVLSLIVLSQIIVERSLSMGWDILRTQASRKVRDVCITSATVIHVNDWL